MEQKNRSNEVQPSTVPNAAADFNTTEGGSGWMFKAIIAVVVLAAIAAGVLAFRGGDSSDVDIKSAAMKMADVESFGFEGNVNIKAIFTENGLFIHDQPDRQDLLGSIGGVLAQDDTDKEARTMTGDILIKGSIDVSDPDREAVDLDLELKVDMPGTVMTADMEIRTIGDEIYLKYNELPFGIGILLGELSTGNDWIRWEQPAFGQTNEEVEAIEALLDALEESDLYVEETNEKGERMDGESTRKITFSVDTEGLIEFLKKFGETIDESMSSTDEETLREFIESLNLKGQAWIGINTGYFRKVRITGDVDLVLAEIEEVLDGLEFTVEVSYFDFGKDFDIQAPENYRRSDDLGIGRSDLTYDQFAQANNATRQANVMAILNAVGQYQVDNRGVMPATIPTDFAEVCMTSFGNDLSCNGLVDLSVLTNDGIYLLAIPQDPYCPAECAANGTGYKIKHSEDNRVFVSAPLAELGHIIEVSR